MARLSIVKIGRPVLRRKTAKVKPEMMRGPSFQHFLKDMARVMHRCEGVGLAANQVGCGLQAIVLECRSNSRYPGRPNVRLQTYLNPRILRYSKRTVEDWEGCLSIPGYRGLVPRAQKIVLEATTSDGRLVRKTAAGFEARILQHEVDHINGLFYIDRMKNLKSWMHLDEFASRLSVKKPKS